MKKSETFLLVTILALALQSCSLSGNIGTDHGHGPPVIRTSNAYLADVKRDTSSRMVSLTKYLQPLLTDWKYAGTGNFTGQILYSDPEAFLRRPAALALEAVQAELKQAGVGLKIFDAYRPYSVTKKMWTVVPDERYAANPAKGSGHNRGIAVDLTLVDLASGKELEMPTGYDDFTEKAHHNYMNLDPVVLKNRQLLRSTMEKHGFRALETEWWHYSWADGKEYPLMDFDFSAMRSLVNEQELGVRH